MEGHFGHPVAHIDPVAHPVTHIDPPISRRHQTLLHFFTFFLLHFGHPMAHVDLHISRRHQTFLLLTAFPDNGAQMQVLDTKSPDSYVASCIFTMYSVYGCIWVLLKQFLLASLRM